LYNCQKADDPGYIDALRKVCRDKNIHLVLPLVSKELFPLSQNRAVFEKEGVKLAGTPRRKRSILPITNRPVIVSCRKKELPFLHFLL
jgi:hypothetical protein